MRRRSAAAAASGCQVLLLQLAAVAGAVLLLLLLPPVAAAAEAAAADAAAAAAAAQPAAAAAAAAQPKAEQLEAAAAEAPPADCKALLASYVAASAREPAPFTGDNLVYFLHVPRTAGRTFHSCLLRQGTPGRRRCPKAYDHLRIDTAVPKCYLLSSHDDYSVVEQLPAGTSVVTQLRDPVDRVLSAYEFAVEVAGRQSRRSKNYVKPKARVVTDDVWPWSHLIPFFVADIKPRMTALRAEALPPPPGVWSEQRADDGRTYYWNKVLNTSKWTLDEEETKLLLPNLDPYDNQMFMPLRDFVRHPIAHDLLHNGELMQVLGLTNYSHWPHAAGLRACAARDAAVADELLTLALRRVERFAHVGTTDRLFESVEAAAAALGMPLNGVAYGAGEAVSANIEANRALTWAEAMKAGNAPVPPPVDDVYSDPSAAGAAPDMHQLAASVRRKREGVSSKASWWNRAIRRGAAQEELRELRGELNAARAELTEAQGELVAARSQDAKKRQLAEEALQTDKTLELALGAEFHRCSTRAVNRNKQRKKSSLLNLRLNDYRQVYFARGDRAAIPAELVDEIRRLNALDVQLHRRALELLEERRQKLTAEGKLQPLPDVSVAEEHRNRRRDEL